MVVIVNTALTKQERKMHVRCAAILCAALTKACVGSVLPSRLAGCRSPRRLSKARCLLGAAEDVCAPELACAVLSDERILLDVYNTWCGPCALLAPQLDAAAQALDGTCRVIKFNTDRVDGPEIASMLAVACLPTLIFLRRGEVLHRAEGFLAADDITALAARAFGQPARRAVVLPPMERGTRAALGVKT